MQFFHIIRPSLKSEKVNSSFVFWVSSLGLKKQQTKNPLNPSRICWFVGPWVCGFGIFKPPNHPTNQQLKS
jgi:hypothetical protein